MTAEVKICFVCRKSGRSKFYNAENHDTDNVTFLDKLKTCVRPDLIVNDNTDMCWLCVKHLRISYKFRETVLASQEALRKSDLDLIKQECEDIKVYIGDGVKSESESDFDYSSDNSCKDLLDTVNSLTEEILKKKRARKPEAPPSCEYCSASFGKHWQLKKHVARVHNDVRKHICEYCKKEFKQSYHLKEHLTSHTGEKNYTCPVCEKKFQRLSSQRRHLKSHDAPPGRKTKRTPFLCTICGKSFPFSNGVQRHMRIHLGIKNFECSLCNRRFTQSTHLQVHMRTHTGEKPYICDTCGEKFSLKSCMLKHITSRHYDSKPLVDELPIFYLHKDFAQT